MARPKRVKLTKRVIDAMETPKAGQQIIKMDTIVPGFGVRANPRSKTFIISYKFGNKRVRGQAIGKFGDLTVDEARAKAKTMLAEIALGLVEPKPEKGAITTFGELCDAFIKDYAKVHRKSWKTDEARVEKHIKPGFGNKPILDLTKSDVVALNTKIGSRDCKTKHCRARQEVCKGHPIEANRNVQLIHRIFDWGQDLGIVPDGHANPARRFKDYRFKEPGKSDRSASPDEVRSLRAAIATTENPYVRAAFWLLFLTGLRKREALHLRWEHVNLSDEGRLLKGRVKLPTRSAYVPVTKSKRPFSVMLSKPAVQLLQELVKHKGKTEWVFPARSKSGHFESIDKQWRRVRHVAEVLELTLHDLRATLSSWRSNAGDHDRLINEMLNQKPPTGVASAYIDTSPERVRRAFEEHGADVLEAAGVDSGAWLLTSAELVERAPGCKVVGSSGR